MAEREDGSLRVLASDGYVCERRPGAPAFVRLFEVGELQRENIGYDPGISRLIRQVAFQPEEVEGKSVQRFELHDVARRDKRDLSIPASYLSAPPAVLGNTAVLALNHFDPGSPDDGNPTEVPSWRWSAGGAPATKSFRSTEERAA